MFSNLFADIDAETDIRVLREMLSRHKEARHTILQRIAHLCSQRECADCAQCGEPKGIVLERGGLLP